MSSTLILEYLVSGTHYFPQGCLAISPTPQPTSETTPSAEMALRKEALRQFMTVAFLLLGGGGLEIGRRWPQEAYSFYNTKTMAWRWGQAHVLFMDHLIRCQRWHPVSVSCLLSHKGNQTTGHGFFSSSFHRPQKYQSRRVYSMNEAEREKKGWEMKSRVIIQPVNYFPIQSHQLGD